MLIQKFMHSPPENLSSPYFSYAMQRDEIGFITLLVDIHGKGSLGHT